LIILASPPADPADWPARRLVVFCRCPPPGRNPPAARGLGPRCSHPSHTSPASGPWPCPNTAARWRRSPLFTPRHRNRADCAPAATPVAALRLPSATLRVTALRVAATHCCEQYCRGVRGESASNADGAATRPVAGGGVVAAARHSRVVVAARVRSLAKAARCGRRRELRRERRVCKSIHLLTRCRAAQQHALFEALAVVVVRAQLGDEGSGIAAGRAGLARCSAGLQSCKPAARQQTRYNRSVGRRTDVLI